MRYELVDRTAECPDKLDRDLLKEAGGSNLLARILHARGVRTAQQAREFLCPDRSQLHDPFLFRAMEKSAKLVKDAMDTGRPICVHGDYDADGTCASAILAQTLKALQADVRVFIPSRSDGYGLSRATIETMPADGLLVTVDCGISNMEEVEFAIERGMDVIITDHHTCPKVLPPATAILNPRAPGETYPNRDLCGAGVAFKLAEAVAGQSVSDRFIDLAAFATIADVVQLTGENRALAKLGIEKMNRNPGVGIEALLRLRSNPEEPVTSTTIAFDLAPAINAAGRVSSAKIAYDLLSAPNPAIASLLGQTLAPLNTRRRKLQSIVTEQALEAIEKDGVPDFVLLADESWHPGVLGPAASKLAEQLNRPVILCAGSGEFFVGSGRTVGDLNLHDALLSAQHLTEKFGGHKQAAGVTVRKENLPTLRAALQDYARRHKDTITKTPIAEYDYVLKMPPDPRLAEVLSVLEPFGAGNPMPVALVPDAELRNQRPLGSEGKHAVFTVVSGNDSIRGVMFSTAVDGLPQRADVLGELQISAYGHKAGTPELIVRGLSWETAEDRFFRKAVEALRRSSGPRDPRRFFRDRDRLGQIYRAFMAAAPQGRQITLPELYAQSKRRLSDLTYEETAFAYAVFEELGLIADQPNGRIRIVPGAPKCDLNDSSIYRVCGR